MATMRHNETAETIYRIGKCERCGKVVRAALEARWLYGWLEVKVNGRWMLEGSRQAKRLSCCDGEVKTQKINATETRTECGAVCQSATGPNCDCHCKGANHGAAA